MSKDGGCACIFLWVFVCQEHTKKREATDRPKQRPKVLLWAKKGGVDNRGAVKRGDKRGEEDKKETRDKRQRQDDNRQERQSEKRGYRSEQRITEGSRGREAEWLLGNLQMHRERGQREQRDEHR